MKQGSSAFLGPQIKSKLSREVVLLGPRNYYNLARAEGRAGADRRKAGSLFLLILMGFLNLQKAFEAAISFTQPKKKYKHNATCLNSIEY